MRASARKSRGGHDGCAGAAPSKLKARSRVPMYWGATVTTAVRSPGARLAVTRQPRLVAEIHAVEAHAASDDDADAEPFCVMKLSPLTVTLVRMENARLGLSASLTTGAWVGRLWVWPARRTG